VGLGGIHFGCACPFIDGVIILYWSEFSVFLFNEEEISGIGTPGFSYGSPLQMFLDKVVNLLDFFLIEG